jgi:hypothetical protein
VRGTMTQPTDTIEEIMGRVVLADYQRRPKSPQVYTHSVTFNLHKEELKEFVLAIIVSTVHIMDTLQVVIHRFDSIRFSRKCEKELHLFIRLSILSS